MQPGETIAPGSETPQQQADLPEPPNNQSVEVPEPQAPEQPEPSSGWSFNPGNADAGMDQSPPPAASDADVTWTASEFVSHEKNAGWYLLVILITAALSAAIYFVTKDLASPIAVFVIGISFAAFGARKPRVLEYKVDHIGVHIGQKLYPYALFRTFSVIQEGPIRSILLMPMQRFNLPINVYYDPKDEDQIIEALGSYLPHEDREPAPIDNFMRRIRF